MSVPPIDPPAAEGGAPAPDRRTELRAAAESFEALLLASLLERIREAQLQEGFFGKSPGASTYEAMFQQHLADSLASGSPLGIADELERRWAARLDGPTAAEQTLREVRETLQKVAAEERYDNLELKLRPGMPMK
jgi:Rod binding domain-containing protein